MLIKRTIIYSITISIVLLAGITAGCLYYISQQQKANEAYCSCRPHQCIATPRDAHIYIIRDNRKASWRHLPIHNATTLPHEKIWQCRQHDSNQPIYIAHYPDNEAAIWCAIKPDDQERICQFISDTLCNGYSPIEEKTPAGTVLHFSTRDNRFLHLFLGNCIMGYSYDMEKLTPPTTADNELNNYIESLKKRNAYTLIYYAGAYNRYDVEATKSGCNLLFSTSQCPVALDMGNAPIDTTLLSAHAKAFIQINTNTNRNLSPTAILAYIPSPENVDSLTTIYSTHITNPRMLHRELLGIYTPYGYQADSAQVTRWMPQALVTEQKYWITTHDSTLYAAHSYKEMERYIDDIKSHRRLAHSDPSTAALFIKSDSITLHLLPRDIASILPPIAQGAKSIVIEKTDKKYNWKIEL